MMDRKGYVLAVKHNFFNIVFDFGESFNFLFFLLGQVHATNTRRSTLHIVPSSESSKKIGEAEANKEKDVDYLSSIEVLVIDHADVIAMQNWSHVNTVVEHLNQLPTKQHATNIMRVRPWYHDEHAQFYRQTILLSSFLNPDINSLFNRHCLNFEGKIYECFDSDSFVEADDARLEYFPKKGGVMLFISSYFEFVRLRNFLKSQNASFCLLGEYTKQSDISRARNWFIQGQRNIMLYTERAHFYHRYKIRGIQNLIIYSPPERKEFYRDS